MPQYVVAIDQSSACCGWAIGEMESKKLIKSGFVKGKKLKKGASIQELSQKIMDLAVNTLVDISTNMPEGDDPPITLLEDVIKVKQKSARTAYAMSAITYEIMHFHCDWPVILTHPNTIKMAVTGNGKATKEDIQMAVTKLFKLDFYPQEDEADALAHLWAYMNGGLRE